jgi:hypothetical protein
LDEFLKTTAAFISGHLFGGHHKGTGFSVGKAKIENMPVNRLRGRKIYRQH